MRSALAMVFATILVTGPTHQSSPCLGDLDDRAGLCEAFGGLAFTFCVALCEARTCDLRDPGDHRCNVLARGFARVSGGATPPCSSHTPASAGPQTL